MANQTELLNVSDEMKLEDDRQNLCEEVSVGELCSSSLDTTEELYSSSATDTCGDCGVTTTHRYLEVLEFTHFVRMFHFGKYEEKYKEKHLVDKIYVSVVIDLGCGNTSEEYTKVNKN